MSRVVNLSYEYDLKNKVLDIIRSGEYQKDAVIMRLSSSNYKLPSAFYNEKILNLEMLAHYVADVITDYGNYETVKRIYSSTIIAPKNNNEWFLYDPKTDTILEKTTEKAIKLAVNGEGPIAKKLTGYSAGYNPHCRSRFFNEGKVQYFNMYEPPSWKRAWWKGDEMPVVDKLPTVYEHFLHHFVDGRESDINYILDWTAESLTGKNQCFLTAVGASGVGKGTFSQILEALHGGEDNIYVMNGLGLNSQFNKGQWGKTLVYINEFRDISGDAAEKIKGFVDSKINIELKGVDSFSSTNHSNYYLSTNRHDSLNLDDSDRRYSLIDLTEKTWDFSGTAALLAPENIEQLAHFLWHRKYDKTKIAKPHQSETGKFMKTIRYTDWQLYLTEEFFTKYKGNKITTRDLLMFLKSKGHKLKNQSLEAWIRETKSKCKVVQGAPDTASIFLDVDKMIITDDKSRQQSNAVLTNICIIL